jgi:chromosome partitioning protein
VQTLAIINQKGGVGKTTTVANLGAAIAARGKRICLIDMDPQAHLTLHVGVEPGVNDLGLYDVLTADASVSDAVVEVTENLSLIPSEIDLAAAETELVTVVGREQILNDRLSACKSNYDNVIIDCPPSLGLLTLNALAAADYVFIPLQAHFLALQGLGKLLETVSLVRQRINPRLKVGGVILCMHERQTRLAGEVVADLEEFLEAARGSDEPWADAKIFTSAIRRNIKLAECPSYGKTIFDYDPYSHGALDYDSLAEEFMKFFSQQTNTQDKPAEPAAQADEPAEETPEPIAQVEEPAEETPEPVAQAEEPAEETPEPVAQAEEPAEETPEPVAQADESAEETPEPVDESVGEFCSESQAVEKPAPAPVQIEQPTIGETD